MSTFTINGKQLGQISVHIIHMRLVNLLLLIHIHLPHPLGRSNKTSLLVQTMFQHLILMQGIQFILMQG